MTSISGAWYVVFPISSLTVLEKRRASVIPSWHSALVSEMVIQFSGDDHLKITHLFPEPAPLPSTVETCPLAAKTTSWSFIAPRTAVLMVVPVPVYFVVFPAPSSNHT